MFCKITRGVYATSNQCFIWTYIINAELTVSVSFTGVRTLSLVSVLTFAEPRVNPLTGNKAAHINNVLEVFNSVSLAPSAGLYSQWKNRDSSCLLTCHAVQVLTILDCECWNLIMPGTRMFLDKAREWTRNGGIGRVPDYYLRRCLTVFVGMLLDACTIKFVEKISFRFLSLIEPVWLNESIIDLSKTKISCTVIWRYTKPVYYAADSVIK